MIFIVRRLRSGLLAQSDIESYFDAIAAAQETVDHCSSIVGMQGKPIRDICFLHTVANKLRTYQPTQGLKKTPRVY